MTTPQVHGALTPGAPQQSQGSAPRPNAAALARARELAALFTASVQASMMESLATLNEEDPESGAAEDGSGSADATDGFGDLDALLGTSALGGTGAATAGAGDEAALAQQLLAAYAAVDGTGTGAAGPGAVGGAAAAGSWSTGAVSGVTAPAGGADARANARVVADVARQQGVDPVAAVAMMLVESSGNAGAVGDGGTSFGLFQLHEGGMLTAAGLTPEQAFDPRTNATVSLRSLRNEWEKGHERRSAGEIAAASQRPADPAGYAVKVDAAMDRARQLLGA